jgi:hypothetical protein
LREEPYGYGYSNKISKIKNIEELKIYGGKIL